MEYLGVTHPFNLSNYQTKILDWVVNGNGNAIVDAVAGSGKTFTLKAISLYLRNALFLAFNKHIADELSKKLVGVNVSTIHSLGLRALKYKYGNNLEVNGRKYTLKLKEMTNDLPSTDPIKVSFNAIRKIVDLMRLTLTPLTEQGIDDICFEYGIELEEDIEPKQLLPVVKDLIFWGEEIGSHRVIDFTDMIYLPVRLKVPPYRYDWVLIDEAQDLNKAQRELVMMAVNRGGRMIFVGDRRQAIYGFAGASTTSMDEIAERINAAELPLSICYRCPKSHIELAKEIVPQIEWAPDAKDGVIERVKYKEAEKNIKSGDLVLCRLTAPLIDLCFSLIGNGIGAKIKGMDIGEKLAGMAEKIAKQRGFKSKKNQGDFQTKFDEFAQEYLKKSIAKILKKNGDDLEDPAIKGATDMVSALLRIMELSDARSLETLTAKISSLFSDENASVWLSTVHRAKGLESDSVWILKEECMPLTKRIRKEWQMEQEWNLRYVALTRSKNVLRFIEEEEGGRKRKGTVADTRSVPDTPSWPTDPGSLNTDPNYQNLDQDSPILELGRK